MSTATASSQTGTHRVSQPRFVHRAWATKGQIQRSGTGGVPYLRRVQLSDIDDCVDFLDLHRLCVRCQVQHQRAALAIGKT